jgi:outer membrane protein assembly factor BamB
MKRTPVYPLLVLAIFIIPCGMPLFTHMTSAAAETNNDDCYWEDDFSDTSDVLLTNCTLSSDGSIILDPEDVTEEIYDFSSWTQTSKNMAYRYRTPFFFPFLSPESDFLKTFQAINYWDYDGIKAKNDGETLNMESTLVKNVVVHQFRFKINQDVESITSIDFYWRGKAENDKEIAMWCWQPIGTMGIWDRVVSGVDSDGAYVPILYSRTVDLCVSSDGYVNMAIVVTPGARTRTCTLYSDYVSLTVHGKGFAAKGTAISTLIAPANISSWERFSFKDYDDRSEIAISYQILDEQGNLINNSMLPGNVQGHTQPFSLVDLNTSRFDKIRLKATLSTTDITYTPKIYRWSVTWQKEGRRWKDMFQSSLRIDDQRTYNIEVRGGSVSLLPFYNDWPLVGQNPANTRASGGYGPVNKPTSPYFYTSNNQVGSEYQTPIVYNGKLYIASATGRYLMKYNATVTTSNIGKKILPIAEGTIPTNEMVNAPAAGEDYLIVATGSSSSGGKENAVYGFKTSNILDPPDWTFNYGDIDPDHPEVCYYGSPVISGDTIYLTSWSGDTSLWNPLNPILDPLNLTKGNNELLALDVETGELRWSTSYDLPAGSFCSPAVSDDLVVACCMNALGDSVFAVDKDTGVKEWSAAVGPIERSNPVIHDNKVFVVVKDAVSALLPSLGAYTKVVALNLVNGRELWNFTPASAAQGDMPRQYAEVATCTPAAYGDYLYVTVPNGTLYALNVDTGEIRWQTKVYEKGIFDAGLTTSPVYAHGVIYIGDPDGYIHALDSDDGDLRWTYTEISQPVSSAIVVDGLLYVSDADGRLYCIGSYLPPGGQYANGKLVSVPLVLPHPRNTSINAYVWDRFYVNYEESGKGDITFSILDVNGNTLLSNIGNRTSISTSKLNTYDTIRLCAAFTAMTSSDVAVLHEWAVTSKLSTGGTDFPPEFYEDSFTIEETPFLKASIDVRDEDTGLSNGSAWFTLSYKNNSVPQSFSDSINVSFDNKSKALETLTVNISAINVLKDNKSSPYLSANITDLKIQFHIEDIKGNANSSEWHDITDIEYPDTEKPLFYSDSFTPKDAWITSTTPTCSIDARDMGDGLNITSALFSLEYRRSDQSGIKITSHAAESTGSDGTTARVKLTADIGALSFSDKITELISIRFYIRDMATPYNYNYSQWYDFQVDTKDPVSYINNTDDIPAKINVTPVIITAYAADEGSGIAMVSLYYRLTTDTQWSLYQQDDEAPYTWSFSRPSGDYELCTIAKDVAGNQEELPDTGNVSFIFDPNPPSAPSFASVYRFDVIPEFTLTFQDDYLLERVEYRLSFRGENEWRILADNIDKKSITITWNLTQNDWNLMQEDVTDYMFFRLTDSLGNRYITPSTGQALRFIKDLNIDVNLTGYEPDLSSFGTWSWDNVFSISVPINDQQIQKVALYYSYSSDNETWSKWEQCGDTLVLPPYEWNFTASKGSGYYRFKTTVWDLQGRSVESREMIVGVTLFPVTAVVLMVFLGILLLVLTIVVVKKMRATSIK